MKHPPPTTGVRPRAKSLPPTAMLKPWKPSLHPHAMRRKLKPSDGPTVLMESITRGTETGRRTDHPPGGTENIRQRETGRKPDPHPKKKGTNPEKEGPRSKNPEYSGNESRPPPPHHHPSRKPQTSEKDNFGTDQRIKNKTHCPRSKLRGRKFSNFRPTLALAKKCQQITVATHIRTARPPPTRLPDLSRFPALRRNYAFQFPQLRECRQIALPWGKPSALPPKEELCPIGDFPNTETLRKQGRHSV